MAAELGTFIATVVAALVTGVGGAYVLYGPRGRKTDSQAQIEAARVARILSDVNRAVRRAQEKLNQ